MPERSTGLAVSDDDLDASQRTKCPRWLKYGYFLSKSVGPRSSLFRGEVAGWRGMAAVERFLRYRGNAVH